LKSRTFPHFLSLNSAISSIFSVLYCALCTVFLIRQNHGISKRQNVRQGAYKWRGMVVLWRHKERSKEGAETEHRRFPPFCFSPWCAFYQINSKHKASPAHKLPRWPEEAE
jgi:hypothetical protein